MDASARFNCLSPECFVPQADPKSSYVPPAILWEEEFVAFAQISQPICIPGQDPRCTP
jgi:hypothetical protein